MRRLALPLEATAYFAIAESLTNAIRHSGTRRTARPGDLMAQHQQLDV